MNDSQKLIRAIRFAADAHRNQRRKDREASPYINHPIELANILANEAGLTDIVLLQAAVLHDVVEDCDVSLEELRAKFGDEVSAVVAEVTDDKSLLKADRKQAQIDKAPHKTLRAANLKLADKIANLRDIASNPPADWSDARKAEYFAWAQRVVDALPDGSDPELSRIFENTRRAGHAVFRRW
jgi:GTP diphosphokinase / guanosine-3',5'-bis(diphosphate) 3'-diphosphatase